MRHRKNPKDVLQVTSFRLPPDVKDFLHAKAVAADRTHSYILIEYLRRWMSYEDTESKQPGGRSE